MNKIATAAILACAIGTVSTVNAASTNTLSAGYAFINGQDSSVHRNMHGLNLSYRYDFSTTDNSFGAIGSFTWATNSQDQDNVNSKLNYYSLLGGPVYRLNEYVSFYALAGVTNLSIKVSSTNASYDANLTSFAYGAGVQFNPVEHLAITAGYEGAKLDDKPEKITVNGFVISAGYRF